MIKDINESGSSNPHPQSYFIQDRPIILPDGRLIFGADDGVNGHEMWVSDGTEAGTTMVKDINPGSEDGFRYD